MTTKQARVLNKIIENKGAISGKELKEAGYSDSIASNPAVVINSKSIQQALIGKLTEHNITIDRILKPISKGLDAKTKHQVGSIDTDNGDGSVSREYVYKYEDNLPLQMSASDRAIKLMGLDKVHGEPSNNGVDNSSIDNEALLKALEAGDTVTLQQIVFSKGK